MIFDQQRRLKTYLDCILYFIYYSTMFLYKICVIQRITNNSENYLFDSDVVHTQFQIIVYVHLKYLKNVF